MLPTPRSSGVRRCRGSSGHLVDGGEEDGRVVLEAGLGAVAVVDVEVDDRDARQTPCGAAHARAATATLENRQKPIGLVRLGVVAGRAHGAEGAARLPRGRRRRPPATAAPAARSAASALPRYIAVSASSGTRSSGSGRMPRIAST